MVGAPLDAAAGDPRFAPERVRAAVDRILERVDRANNGEELHLALRAVLARADDEHDGFPRRITRMPWSWRVETTVGALEVVTVHSPGAEEAAHVVVRAPVSFEARPRRPGLFGALARLAGGGVRRERHDLWLTLCDAGGGWTLTRVEVDREGRYHLDAQPVPRLTDDASLADEALQEIADEDVIPAGETLPFDHDTDPPHQLLDLALVDARFTPAVIESAVRSVTREWQRAAATGRQSGLAAVCEPLVADYALSADLPVRLRGLDIVAFHPGPRPSVFVTVDAVVSDRHPRPRVLCWKLVLDDDLPQHWRLASAYAWPELRDRGPR
ncbi:MAG TPA: hypothetical protein VF549_10285 [Solirubrobacteraceae bacterium]